MLDTSVCVDLIRRRAARVLGRLQSHGVGDVGVSAITVAELEYGVARSGDPARNADALARFLSAREIAPFDDRAATPYGRIRSALEDHGNTIGSMDLLIAAHAVSLGVRLVTVNDREFRRVPGLHVENWSR